MLRSLLSRRLRARRQSLSHRVAAVVEALEDRTLLAGTVVASFDGTTLELTGDNVGNQVDVLIDGTTGGFQVIGLTGTMINGQASFTMASSTIENFKATMNSGSDTLNISCLGAVPACLPGWAWIGLGNARDTLTITDMGFKDGIDIQGNQGHDNITLQNVETAPGWFNDINIDGGTNNDTITLESVNAGEDVNIEGRHGIDTIRINNSSIGDDLKIKGQQGTDSVYVTDTSVDGNINLYGGNADDELILFDVEVGGDVTMKGEYGHDYLAIFDSEIDWAATMEGGKGKDEIIVNGTDIDAKLKIRGGDYHDLTIVTDSQFGGELNWHGGKGNDGFIVSGTDIGGNLELNGGDGADLIATSGTHVYGEAWIAGNDGNDAVVISDTPDGSNTFEWNLMIKLGHGNDVLHICGVHTANADVVLDGGSDFDRLLVEQMQNIAGQRIIMGFESENSPTVPTRTAQMIANLIECFPDAVESTLSQICTGTPPPPMGPNDVRNNDTSDPGDSDQPLDRLDVGQMEMVTGFVGADGGNGDVSDSRLIKFEATGDDSGQVLFQFMNTSQSNLQVTTRGGDDPNSKSLIDVSTVAAGQSIMYTVPESQLGDSDPCLTVDITNLGTSDAQDGDTNYKITVTYQQMTPPPTGDDDTSVSDQSGLNSPVDVAAPDVNQAAFLTGYLGQFGGMTDSVDEYRFDITNVGDVCGDFSFVLDEDITFTAFEDGMEIPAFRIGQQQLDGRVRYDLARSPLRGDTELIIRLTDPSPSSDSSTTNYTLVYGVTEFTPADSRTTDLSAITGPVDVGDGGNCFATMDTITGYVGQSNGTSDADDAYRLLFVPNSQNLQTVTGTVSATSTTPIQYVVRQGMTILASGTVQPGQSDSFSEPRDQSAPPVTVEISALGSSTDTADTNYELTYELVSVPRPPDEDMRTQDLYSETAFEQIDIPGKFFNTVDLGDSVSFNGFVDAGTDDADRPLIVLSDVPQADTMLTITFENKADVPRDFAIWGREGNADIVRQLSSTTVAAGQTITVPVFNTTDSFVDIGLDIDASAAGNDGSGLDQNYCVTFSYTNSIGGVTMSGTVNLTNDIGMDGFIDPGDTFEVDVSLTNTSSAAILIAFNPMDVVVGGAGVLVGVTNVMSPITLQPGQTLTVGTAQITVPPMVTPPADIFLAASATANGVPVQAHLSPITVGVSADQEDFGGSILFGV